VTSVGVCDGVTVLASEAGTSHYFIIIHKFIIYKNGKAGVAAIQFKDAASRLKWLSANVVNKLPKVYGCWMGGCYACFICN